jgi:penicillin-binding protein 1A
VNEWAERQQRLEEQRLAGTRPKRGLEPGKIVDWLTSLPHAMTMPGASSTRETPRREKRT